MFHDPVSPRYRPGGRNDAIRLIYQRLDAAIGALIHAAGDDVTVCVVSDHGFGGAGTGVIHLNNWLAERDYLKFEPARPNLLKSAALSLVPQRLRGAMFRRLQDMAARAESQSRFAGIDWNHTFAWSEELNYFPSIRVNLKGREPAGRIEPENYRDFCAKLCEELESWPPIKKAWRREMLYQGPYVERAPDIVLELALEQGYSYSCLRSRGGPGFRRLRPEEYNGGKERGMNGSHRQAGVFFSSEQVPCGAALIEDIAPTVLAQLQVPAPDMDGTPLFGGGADCDPVPMPDPPKRDEAPYTREQEKEIEERLRALGYLE
jgi:predicted AlkP superfamily phosphohydrolase/phosphomutase